nr:hypothetical protein [uncultured Methanobrevibacter sp.]
MKLKKFAIFIFLFLLVCCANAVYATSDNNIMELDQSDSIVPLSDGDDGTVPQDGGDSTGDGNGTDDGTGTGDDTGTGDGTGTGDDTDSDDVTPSTGTGNSSSGGSTTTTTPTTTTTSTLTPYQQFTKDLNNGVKTIYLTGNMKISKPFDIKYKVVIDGKGHYIDAQKKTFIFKVYSTSVTFKNIFFKNGKSDKGGAIWGYKSTVNLNNCTFASNRVTDSGGAIYMYCGTLILLNLPLNIILLLIMEERFMYLPQDWSLKTPNLQTIRFKAERN